MPVETAASALPHDPAGMTFDGALAMPWRVKYELLRGLALPLVRLHLRLHGVAWPPGGRLYGRPILQRHRGSRIELGAGVRLRSWRGTNPLVPYHPVVLATRTAHAVIRIGPGTGLTGGRVVAAERVEIGRDVYVGANATIVDTDFHPLRADERRRYPSAGAARPVVIEDEVFIGMGAVILKGVTVGARSVVGAHAVVVSDVPPDTVVAGNPARVVRRLV